MCVQIVLNICKYHLSSLTQTLQTRLGFRITKQFCPSYLILFLTYAIYFGLLSISLTHPLVNLFNNAIPLLALAYNFSKVKGVELMEFAVLKSEKLMLFGDCCKALIFIYIFYLFMLRFINQKRQ